MTVILFYKKRIGVIKKEITEQIIREKIIKLILLQKSIIYKKGGHEPDGFDCAGLVWYVYHEILDIDIYEGGFGGSTTGKILTSCYGKIISLEETKKGDILFFHRQSKDEYETTEDNKYPGHCGIYLGNNRFIHCSGTKGKVIINNFSKSEYWNKVFISSKDILSDSEVIKVYQKKTR